MGGFAAVFDVGREPLEPSPAHTPNDSSRVTTTGTREVSIAYGVGGDALALCGYAIRDGSRVDAESLLETWRHEGVRMLERLRGEFAVVVRVGGVIVAARDRLGTRPLYAADLPGGAVGVATSIGPLLSAGASREVDRDAVVRSLILGYVPAPQTTLAHVRQIGPGEAWTLAPVRRAHRYFRPDERIARGRSFRHTARVLDDTVTRAVQRALPGQGRVGAFLSGGLDSSLVLARVHEAGHPVEAFTLHFGDGLPSEIRYARAVAEHLGIRHNVLELDARAFCDGLAPALERLEDLLSEPISVPNFLLAREAARSVDVLFTGEGGDPPFGGPKNVGLALAQAYEELEGAPSLGEAYLSAHHHLGDDITAAITPEWLSCFDYGRLVEDLVLPAIDARAGAPGQTFVGRLMLANTVLKGGSNILVKAAKMVCAHDLALRSPLFDPDVVELAFTIPPWFKLRGTDEKLVLKAAASRSLPRCVVERSKRGMAVPLRAWLARDLGVLARDVLTERAVRDRGLFRWPYVARLLRGQDPPTDIARSRAAEKLWMVLVTELQQRMLERMHAAEAA